MMNQRSFFSLAKKSFAFCFGGIWLLCGVPFLIIGIYLGIDGYHLQERFKKDAAIAEGIVLTKSIRGHKDSESYWIGYRFRASDGSFVKNEVRVDGASWDRFLERGSIRVRYLPDHPRINRIDGAEANWLMALIFTGFGLFFVPIGGWIFFTGVRGVARELNLSTNGMPTQATVTSIVPAEVSIDGVPQWRIRYRYQDHRGRNYTSESSPMSPEAAKEWRTGDQGTAKFDLKAPGKSVWIGKL